MSVQTCSVGHAIRIWSCLDLGSLALPRLRRDRYGTVNLWAAYGRPPNVRCRAKKSTIAHRTRHSGSITRGNAHADAACSTNSATKERNDKVRAAISDNLGYSMGSRFEAVPCKKNGERGGGMCDAVMRESYMDMSTHRDLQQDTSPSPFLSANRRRMSGSWATLRAADRTIIPAAESAERHSPLSDHSLRALARATP